MNKYAKKPTLVRKSSLALMVAAYVGSAGASAQFTKDENSGLYMPNISKEQVEALKEKNAQATLFGNAPQLNRQYQAHSPKNVFTPTGDKSEQTFIVQFSDTPVASYQGGVHGFAATAPSTTRTYVGRSTLNMHSSEVRSYQRYLQSEQQSAISSAQSAGAYIQVSKQFTVANNAAVVRMTEADAMILAKQSNVRKITPNRILELQTDRGPEFVGADKVWSGSANPQGVGSKGEGMVVGIIDTGINTDHVAFASDEDYAASNPLGAGNFLGDCVDEPSMCNDKLIGVRSYDEITKANSDYVFAREDRRPENGEDYNGHGSHTASTAAGNYLENTPMQQITGEKVSDGVDMPFDFPHTSGVAPRAHIVAYQACHAGNAGDPYVGCPESAILSAFEDAIADGVDVINFSIGGGESFSWEDPIELAMLNARQAGIHVAAAAGNSGPSYYTADHTSPWVTTVGASYHDRVLSLGEKSLTGFQGDNAPAEEIIGKSFSGSITGQVVLAENFDDPDLSDDFDAASCNAPFPAGTFTSDQIVVCERGDAPRVDKAQNVASGGAGGFILQNVLYNQDDVVPDEYVIPGIHINRTLRWKLRNWVNDNGEQAIATITDSTNVYTQDPELGNQIVPFSSMGPSRYINNLVPDLTAPGVDIYAANADEQPFTANPAASDWTMMSGTSMATPHVAGAMALLSSIHPDWSPAEVQSALMMTASDTSIMLTSGLQAPYYTFMSGAGALNVENAAKAGLIMDESYQNYVDANPRNGGLVEWLNVPSMVNMNCELSCSWMRTVTATQDGSWDVEGRAWAADGRSEELGLSIEVQPKSFSLKAGESQDVRVTINLPNIIEHKLDPADSAEPWDMVQNLDTWFNGEVTFIDQEGDAPDAHLPIAARNMVDELPLSVDMDVARDTGSETLVVNTDSYSQLTPRYYGLVKPQTKTVTLNGAPPFVMKEYVEESWDIEAITVPEGAKRLVVKLPKTEQVTNLDEIVDPRYQNTYAHLIVGFDADNSGSFMLSDEEADAYSGALRDAMYDEMVCYSSSNAEHNYCNIVDPAPGQYWIATALINASRNNEYEVTREYAIVTEQDNGQLAVTGPASHDGNGNYEIKVNWDMPDAVEGETYYGGFDLGDMPGAEGTLGFTSLNVHRDGDVLNATVSQDKARAMDVVDVTVKLKANYESDSRDYDMELVVPEGLRLAEQTIMSNNDDIAERMEVDGNTIRIAGTQQSTRNVTPEYVLTNNITDASCRTPAIDEQSDGGYIDLHGDFGMQPNLEWMVGNYRDSYDVAIDWLFYEPGTDFKMYNQPSINQMRLYPVGVIQTTPYYWSMKYHRGPGFLTEALAPFWRGTFEMNYQRHPDDPSGLTVASQYNEERPDLGDLLFLEYDNVIDSESGESYDFEVILRSGYDDRANQYEIIYAYDNLGAELAEGAIFVEGGASTFSKTAGFKDGGLFTMIGYNDLDKILQDDLVLCFDYVGPEQSEVEFSFKAAVLPQASGTTQSIMLNSQLGSAEAKSQSFDIQVQGNLKMSALDDMTVAENSRIDGIEVSVLDADQSPNELMVEGENITAEIDGMSFNLIPEAHFHGETQVTVTVADKAYPSDKVSQTFMLTVESDGQEPPVEVTPEPEVETSSSSGSFGVFSLLALMAFGLRRKFK